MTIFVTINKKSIPTEITGKEAQKQGNRVRYAMKLQDEKADQYWADLKSRGTCPKCNLVLHLTKYCYKCQTTYN